MTDQELLEASLELSNLSITFRQAVIDSRRETIKTCLETIEQIARVSLLELEPKQENKHANR
jgi:hypothetical protein